MVLLELRQCEWGLGGGGERERERGGFLFWWGGVRFGVGRPPLAGTSRNIYWRRFSEDIVSAARHFTYTPLMVRRIYFGALDGPQTTEAPYATLLTYFGNGRTLLGKQLVRRRKPPLSGFLRKCILSIWCTSRTGMTIFRHLFPI